MDLQWNDAAVAGRVESYIEDLARVLDHKHRHEPFRHYCTGLLLPRNRKSVEPMAARLAPGWVTAEHQLLLHFVGQSPWSSEGPLAVVRTSVLPALTGRGPVETWIVDCRNRVRGVSHPRLRSSHGGSQTDRLVIGARVAARALCQESRPCPFGGKHSGALTHHG